MCSNNGDKDAPSATERSRVILTSTVYVSSINKTTQTLVHNLFYYAMYIGNQQKHVQNFLHNFGLLLIQHTES